MKFKIFKIRKVIARSIIENRVSIKFWRQVLGNYSRLLSNARPQSKGLINTWSWIDFEIYRLSSFQVIWKIKIHNFFYIFFTLTQKVLSIAAKYVQVGRFISNISMDKNYFFLEKFIFLLAQTFFEHEERNGLENSGKFRDRPTFFYKYQVYY